MATLTEPGKNSSKVGMRIVRNWFDTIINPLLLALKAEQARLEKKDWTWQHFANQLESIRQVKQMISPLAEDNLEQFISFYPSIGKAISLHDRERDDLLKACQDLQSVLENSAALKSIYEQVKVDDSPTPQGRTVNEVLLSNDDELHCKFIAEYMVNRTGELPDYITYAAAWNKYRKEFVESLSQSEIRKQNELVECAGARLLKTSQKLTVTLKQTRQNLSIEHDEPYVTASTIYG